MSDKHICFACLTGSYADERMTHTAVCGHCDESGWFLVANNDEGAAAVRGATCAKCLVGADKWLESHATSEAA